MLRFVEYSRAGSKFGSFPKFMEALSKAGTKLVLGALVLMLSVSAIAYQDIADFGSSRLPTELRWTAHAVKVPTGSTYAASFGTNIDFQTTGSVQNKLKIETLGWSPENKSTPRSGKVPSGESIKINRALKGDRVISSSIKQPPTNFSAGSVVQKSNLLKRTTLKSRSRMTFNVLRKSYQPIQLAGNFLYRKPAIKRTHSVKKPNIMLAKKGGRLKSSPKASTLVAYVPVDSANDSPFSSLFKKSSGLFSKPVLGSGDHKWALNKLPKKTSTKSEQNCLARGIYFEARGESVRGQAAVAQVILNRVKNPAYPNTICGVVYQNKTWKNRCQFSFACDGIRDRVKSKKSWKTAKDVAALATAGKIWSKEIGSATHYYATYVKPRWARTMTRMKKIGRHIFFRTKGGGWS